MQAIREIRTVEQGQITLNLPPILWGRRVEIIVLPMPQSEEAQPSPKKSLLGCLHQYARPELIATEQGAWLEAVREKHVLG